MTPTELWAERDHLMAQCALSQLDGNPPSQNETRLDRVEAIDDELLALGEFPLEWVTP